ncbi:HipA N-terminal domain-containing protein, partial [Roseateles sp. GG27B]
MAAAALNTVAYQPGSELYLWWLSQPERPLLIGTLQLIRARQGVSLHYAATWLQNGFALSEDLPLIDMEFLPAVKESAAGAVDDARPDRWGERVIRFLDQPPRLSLLEFLFYAGDERFGALGVSVSAATYQPRWFGLLPELSDVAAIDRLVRQVLAGDAVAAEEYRLIAPGVTLGGARPKALLN